MNANISSIRRPKAGATHGPPAEQQQPLHSDAQKTAAEQTHAKYSKILPLLSRNNPIRGFEIAHEGDRLKIRRRKRGDATAKGGFQVQVPKRMVVWTIVIFFLVPLLFFFYILAHGIQDENMAQHEQHKVDIPHTALRHNNTSNTINSIENDVELNPIEEIDSELPITQEDVPIVELPVNPMDHEEQHESELEEPVQEHELENGHESEPEQPIVELPVNAMDHEEHEHMQELEPEQAKESQELISDTMDLTKENDLESRSVVEDQKPIESSESAVVETKDSDTDLKLDKSNQTKAYLSYIKEPESEKKTYENESQSTQTIPRVNSTQEGNTDKKLDVSGMEKFKPLVTTKKTNKNSTDEIEGGSKENQFDEEAKVSKKVEKEYFSAEKEPQHASNKIVDNESLSAEKSEQQQNDVMTKRTEIPAQDTGRMKTIEKVQETTTLSQQSIKVKNEKITIEEPATEGE